MGLCCSFEVEEEDLKAKDLEALQNLPKPLWSVARFIQRVESDYDFLCRMHQLRVWHKTDETVDYIFHEGFHGYSLELYWPIIRKWVLERWRHQVEAREDLVISFRVDYSQPSASSSPVR